MDRRSFLAGGLTAGCSAAASVALPSLALARAPWDARLVVIILRGAMDGLDVIRPLGDPGYAALRPTLNTDGTLGAGFWGLHPALGPLWPLWQAGEVGAVHAVSTPYRDQRSHFDGQDLLEAGGTTLAGAPRDGWLNRLVATQPGMAAETAYAIGRAQMLVLSGDAPVARWSPETRLDVSPQALRLLELVNHDDPLFREASAQAVEIAASVAERAASDAALGEAMMSDPMMAEVSPRGAHVAMARFAASRLVGETRIAAFSLNGWDTHENQIRALPRALGTLTDSILTLKAGLGPVWDKTAVLCLTEFGRTAAENGTGGTDHGTAGAVLFGGGALRGGQVLGAWPGLAEVDLYDRRDLAPTRDVRAVMAEVLGGLFGISGTDLSKSIFPGLQIDPPLGIVA